MKTYLVTYYFVDGSVYAVRYDVNCTLEDFVNSLGTVDKLISTNNYNEIVNINNVCRFTVEEIEGEGK